MLMVAARFAGDPQVHRLRARDIAVGGVRLAYGGEARVGEPVTVEFAAIGAVPGVIAWVADGEVGVRFTRPIDPQRARRPVTGEYRPLAHPQTRPRLRPV